MTLKQRLGLLLTDLDAENAEEVPVLVEGEAYMVGLPFLSKAMSDLFNIYDTISAFTDLLPLLAAL